MGRRIWIVKQKEALEEQDFKDAERNNCPEIINGIPPALQYIVHDFDLPCAYEEPEPLPPPVAIDFQAEFDSATTVTKKVNVLAKILGLQVK